MISDETLNRIKKFNSDRDWEQFHTPANLAKSISIEAAELLEVFQWSDKYDIDKVKEELADVLIYSIDMIYSIGLDIDEIINKKIDLNEKKYPIDKAKGMIKKYTEL